MVGYMKRVLFKFLFFILLANFLFAQQYGSIKDSRDGKVYKTVKIGQQVWMAENLSTERFQNGDIIPEARNDAEWIKAGDDKQPAWCYYNNDPILGSQFGKLYNWYAVIDSRGLSPSGWHIPLDIDWIKMIDLLGGTSQAAIKMKSTYGWFQNKGGNNQSGFSALPGGYRYGINGKVIGFYGIPEFGGFWSSTSSSINEALMFPMGYNGYSGSLNTDLKNVGLSVRCIKNANTVDEKSDLKKLLINLTPRINPKNKSFYMWYDLDPGTYYSETCTGNMIYEWNRNEPGWGMAQMSLLEIINGKEGLLYSTADENYDIIDGGLILKGGKKLIIISNKSFITNDGCIWRKK